MALYEICPNCGATLDIGRNVRMRPRYVQYEKK